MYGSSLLSFTIVAFRSITDIKEALTIKIFDAHLLSLVESGVKVKATGFGRVSLNVQHALKAIYAINPEALLFGTDLPSTRADRPFTYTDVELITQTFDEKSAHEIFYDNAQHWYFR